MWSSKSSAIGHGAIYNDHVHRRIDSLDSQDVGCAIYCCYVVVRNSASKTEAMMKIVIVFVILTLMCPFVTAAAEPPKPSDPVKQDSTFREQFPHMALLFPVVTRDSITVEAFGCVDGPTLCFFAQAGRDDFDVSFTPYFQFLVFNSVTGEILSDSGFCHPCDPNSFSLTAEGLVVMFAARATSLTFVNGGLSLEERSTLVKRTAKRFGVKQRFFVEELSYSGAVNGVIEGFPVRVENNADAGAEVTVTRVIERHPKATTNMASPTAE